MRATSRLRASGLVRASKIITGNKENVAYAILLAIDRPEVLSGQVYGCDDARLLTTSAPHYCWARWGSARDGRRTTAVETTDSSPS
jgi:hypothetical protein